MAWFHKTLSDAKKEAEKQLKKDVSKRDWTKTLGILKPIIDVEKHEQAGLARAGNEMANYVSAVDDLYTRLIRRQQIRNRSLGEDGDIETRFEQALDSVTMFERILLRLINDEKKLK